MSSLISIKHILIASHISTCNNAEKLANLPDYLEYYWQEIILAVIPGIINSYQSRKEIKQNLFNCPLLSLKKYYRFWLYLIIWNFALTSFLFWVLFSLSLKPGINLITLIQSIGFGITFINIVYSSKIQLRPFESLGDLDVGTKYNWFRDQLIESIEEKERLRTAFFWSDIEEEFKKLNYEQINGFLTDLKKYYEANSSQKKKRGRFSRESEFTMTKLMNQLDITMRTENIREKVSKLIPLFQELSGQEMKIFLQRHKIESIIKKHY